jgi:anaerobic ribonucleoside-triphosphate reductase
MLRTTVKGVVIDIPDEERTLCEIWSRVMGYYRPLEDWNIGKKEEFKDRVNYKESMVL